MAGFTSAWLIGKDEVNNHFGVRNTYVNIAIVEPNWSSVGCIQASKLQPGMRIFKDPRVQNIYEDSCYIRVKYEILDSNGDIITDENTLNAIKSAISYHTDGDDCTNHTSYNTTNFTEYDDGWYYYTSGGYCRLLDSVTATESASGGDPKTVTEPLFTDVLIPTTKAEYQYFAQPFSIAVKAEAVFGSGIEEATIANVKARFDAVMNSEDDSDESKALNTAPDSVATGAAATSDTTSEPVVTGVAVAVAGFGEV
jgi:hypothetical protein